MFSHDPAYHVSEQDKEYTEVVKPDKLSPIWAPLHPMALHDATRRDAAA